MDDNLHIVTASAAAIMDEIVFAENTGMQSGQEDEAQSAGHKTQERLD